MDGLGRVSFHLGNLSLEIEAGDELLREALDMIRERLPANLPLEVAIRPDPKPVLSAAPDEDENKSGEPVDLREYFQSRRSKNDMHKVVVLAQYAKEHRGLDEFTDKDILPLFQESGDKKLPADLNTTFRNAARKNYGWLESVSGKRGYWRVTNTGYRLVHNDLI